MEKIMQTAPCRFCGQMVQIEADEKLTKPQAEEKATMTCQCPEAVEYQKEKQRKECSTGEKNRRGDCEHPAGSSRGDLFGRACKGHFEPTGGR